MINQKYQNENTQNEFSHAIKKLRIGKLLRQSNITKRCEISSFEVFQLLIIARISGEESISFPEF